jgi:hypothetical protein
MTNTKEIVDFIYSLLQKRTAEELDRDLRLYLHTYFHCEFTITMSVSYPNAVDDNTLLKG